MLPSRSETVPDQVVDVVVNPDTIGTPALVETLVCQVTGIEDTRSTVLPTVALKKLDLQWAMTSGTSTPATFAVMTCPGATTKEYGRTFPLMGRDALQAGSVQSASASLPLWLPGVSRHDGASAAEKVLLVPTWNAATVVLSSTGSSSTTPAKTGTSGRRLNVTKSGARVTKSPCVKLAVNSAGWKVTAMGAWSGGSVRSPQAARTSIIASATCRSCRECMGSFPSNGITMPRGVRQLQAPREKARLSRPAAAPALPGRG